MNGLHGYLYSKEKLPKRKLVKRETERERELITKEVTKQAMTYLAWSIHAKQSSPIDNTETEV